jgi:23S rRNA pseudouridine1911/1915/1917 synthase
MKNTAPSSQIQLSAIVPSELNGKRLDQALALLFVEHSRSRLKDWVEKGHIVVNGVVKRPKDKVQEGDNIKVNAEVLVTKEWTGEEIPLDIVYEDEHILVINKQTSFVVHPAAGNQSGTLVNALLHRFPSLNLLPRAGIVHRLDKDTTGLMVIAKTLAAQTKLVSSLQARQVKRIYEAVVHGVMTGGGKVDAPIGRHPRERTKMAVIDSGKVAITHYRLVEKFAHHTHVRIQLETGRTHQIRVHMAYIQHPIIGDKAYGGRLRNPPNTSESLREYLRAFPRQALHATSLGLLHPITEEEVNWEVPLPEDMQQLLQRLQQEKRDKLASKS